MREGGRDIESVNGRKSMEGMKGAVNVNVTPLPPYSPSFPTSSYCYAPVLRPSAPRALLLSQVGRLRWKTTRKEERPMKERDGGREGERDRSDEYIPTKNVIKERKASMRE
jgi:hypothetical protein